MNTFQIACVPCALALSLSMNDNAYARQAGGDGGEAPSSFKEAITNGKVSINLRLRLEVVAQDGVGQAEAWTSRLRLGYGTQAYNGYSFYVDIEDIRSADDDRYNAAGLNNRGNLANVADPEDTELNQLYVKYDPDERPYSVKFGRQRIKLDDDRFIGNVGWRQNEQTFDAFSLNWNPADDFTVFYAFVWDVNRIFGPDSNRDYDSESHFINIAYTGWEFGKLVGFAYLLDLENGAVPAGEPRSSDTYGFRFSGNRDLDDVYNLGYVLSYAEQVDAGDNATDYDAEYFLAELSLTKKDLGTIGVAYELLSSDNSVQAFQTPLATGHKFNGWADAFLNTPAAGLEDLYFFVKAPLPWEVKGALFVHFFETDDGSTELGEEIDFVLSKKIDSNWSVLAKFAEFNGKSGNADRTKFWLQTTFTF